jgi:transposase
MAARFDPVLRRRISELKREGLSQKEISARLHVHRNSVYRHLRALGLTGNLPGPQNRPDKKTQRKILALLMRMSRKDVQQKLGVSEWAVRKIAEANSIRGIPPAVRAKIAEEIRGHHNYLSDILWKFRNHRVGYKTVRQIAREELGPAYFRKGASKPPLSSDFPQRYFPQGVVTFEQLADAIVSRFEIRHATAEILCAGTMQCTPCLQELPPYLRTHFERKLLAALRTRMAAEVAPDSKWLN